MHLRSVTAIEFAVTKFGSDGDSGGGGGGGGGSSMRFIFRYALECLMKRLILCFLSSVIMLKMSIYDVRLSQYIFF